MSETIATARVLVVSREIALLRPLWVIGEANSWNLETVSSGWEAMERIQSGFTPNLLILDMPRGDSDSLHILRWMRRISPDLPLVAVFHPEDAAKRREATHLGAEEVLIRPLDDARLEDAMRKHLAARATNNDPKITTSDIEYVAEEEYFLDVSHVMQKLRAQAEMLAQVNVPVMILGEPGSGKGVVARLIHKLSVHSGFEFTG